MNILIATNHDYLKYTLVMLYSLFAHNNTKVDVFLPYSSLPEEDVAVIDRFIGLYPDKSFFPIKLGDEFDNKVQSHNDISIETYYRILAIDLLPKEIDKILYLDVDMVIQGSLQELYDTDITGYPFLVCEDILGILNGFHEANKYRMNIPKEYSYFNAGVMLFNLDYLRETNAASEIIDRIYANQDRYEYNDQDVLNEMYYDRLLYAPWDKYNCPPGIYMLDKDAMKNGKVSFADYEMIKSMANNPEQITQRFVDVSEQIKDSAVIIHYMGASKPWKADKNSTTFKSFNSVYFKYELPAENRMDKNAVKFVSEKTDIIRQLLSDNYSFYYLKDRIEKAVSYDISKIIFGSSYGVQGILDSGVPGIVNISSPSQDLSCSFELCRMVLKERREKGYSMPDKCFFLIGYYALYDDISKAGYDISKLLNITYAPLGIRSNDAKGNEYCYRSEIINHYPYLTENMIEECDQFISSFMNTNNYFNSIYTREDNDKDYTKPFSSLNDDEKRMVAKLRTDKHNYLKKHTEIKAEIISKLEEVVKEITEGGVTPVFMVAPFSTVYNESIDSSYKEEIFSVLNELSYPVEFVDMNEFTLFDDNDFFDSDHLNDKGAAKLTEIIKGI